MIFYAHCEGRVWRGPSLVGAVLRRCLARGFYYFFHDCASLFIGPPSFCSGKSLNASGFFPLIVRDVLPVVLVPDEEL